jgi:hypothetical protein
MESKDRQALEVYRDQLKERSTDDRTEIRHAQDQANTSLALVIQLQLLEDTIQTYFELFLRGEVPKR